MLICLVFDRSVGEYENLLQDMALRVDSEFGKILTMAYLGFGT